MNLSWRILRDPPDGGVRNMAIDTAIARCQGEEEGTLRIYRWARPTLSFGRHQPAVDRYDPWAIQRMGAEVVRRPTGGREVLHDRELTYAMVVPLRATNGLRATYLMIHRAFLDALRSLGVFAEMCPLDRATPDLGSGACFARPSGGEIMVDGRKLLGSAQARIGSALLQHGSLLLGPGSIELDALQAPGRRDLPPRDETREATSHRPDVALSEVMPGSVSFRRVAATLEAALAASVGGKWTRGERTAEESKVATAFIPHYASSQWTWRR